MVAPGGGACVVFPMRYGQLAGGTHPTGMHSCIIILFYLLVDFIIMFSVVSTC